MKPAPRRLFKAGAGCFFHEASPGLPGDRKPGDGDERTDPRDFKKAASHGLRFKKAGPSLPGSMLPGDDDK